MLTSIKGVYENGTIRLMKEVPHISHSEVLITFLETNQPKEANDKPEKAGVRLGSWEGLIKLPDDFNEPMEDLKDYM